jgi:predicted Zn finger-like uncharacterized protein
MKFLCENCKAKYQIADDKVAGRTVRMKCRQCGHMIEVQASVTETSVSSKLEDVSESLAPESLPKPGLPPRPGGAAVSGATARKPLAPKDAPRPGGGGSALAGAFSKAVVVPPAEGASAMSTAVAVLSSANTEEWYAGINGVPVGPMRLSELRRRAQQGFVDEDTLVWRDGLEEWVPLRTFPELCGLLKEAAAAARASLTPAAPSVIPPAPKPPPGAGRPAMPRPPAPRAVPPPPSARSNVVPLSARRATDAATAEEPLPEVELYLDVDMPTASPAEVVRADHAAAAEPAVPVPVSAPVPAAAAASRPRDSTPDFRRRRGGVPTIAWLVAILVGVLGGMVMMLVIARQPQPAIAPSAVPVIVTVAAAPQPKAETDDTSTTIGSIEVMAGGGVKGATGAAKPAGAKTDPVPAAGPGPAPTGNTGSGLSGLTGLVAGPNVASGAAAGPAPQLNEADISRVVQSRRAFVARRCWEPALAGRPANAPTNAKVTATLSIAADGRVSDAGVSGGEAFPGLASCVQGQVKTWTFPRNEGGTTTKIPFVFAGQ